ncbi:peptidase inhibitor family I36 protein [Cellulomonas hominis]
MSIRRRLGATVVASALLVAGTAALATPASAATRSCTAGYTCLWGDAAYETGGKSANSLKFQNYITNFNGYTYSNTKTNANDSASSLYNAGSTAVLLYKNANKSSHAFTLLKGQDDGNLNNSDGYGGSGHNDNLSSGYYEYYTK